MLKSLLSRLSSKFTAKPTTQDDKKPIILDWESYELDGLYDCKIAKKDGFIFRIYREFPYGRYTLQISYESDIEYAIYLHTKESILEGIASSYVEEVQSKAS